MESELKVSGLSYNKKAVYRFGFIVLFVFSIYLLVSVFSAGRVPSRENLPPARVLGGAQGSLEGSGNCHPTVRSSEDPNGERSLFDFSPDHRYISFVQNVFDEYGEDWARYWAVVIFNPSIGGETTLFVDDMHLSSYQWLDNKTLRVFHSAGTEVRTYLDVFLDQAKPIFSKDFIGSGPWSPDEEYVRQSKDTQEAYRVYSNYNVK